jgi:hypothetical protein
MQNIYFVGTILSIAGLLVYLTKNNRLQSKTTSWALIILIIADLFYFGLGLNPLIGKEFYTSVPKTLKVVKEDNGLHRVMVTPKTIEYYSYLHGPTLAAGLETAKTALIPNLGLRYHLFESEGYASLVLKDYMDFLEPVKRISLKEAQHLLGLANVRYLISQWVIEEEGMKPVYNKGINVYENLYFFPRVFFVSEAVVIKDRGEVIERLFDPDFDPTKEVILEEGGRRQGSGIRGQGSGIRCQGSEDRKQNLKPKNYHSPLTTHHSPLTQIIEYQPNQVIIKTSLQEPGFLFLSDTYYPGWTAYIDGAKTKIYRANYTFRAIELPAGEHVVEFVYRPLSFRIGVLGSVLTLITLIGYGIWKKRRS